MSLITSIENLQLYFQQSPVLKSKKNFPGFEGFLGNLNKHRHDLQILSDKCESPLKMVIMGEVKAGKSTLLNALAGEDVSPTNVSEATASIIEVNYSPERKGEIVKIDKKIEGNIEEIYDILNRHKGDFEFFQDVESVKLQFPIANLRKLHLIDTPGLGTVTQMNQETTMNFIQNCDVVLWVFSAHHLGQADIEEHLATVSSYGKPIIAVINRLDETDGQKEELEEYIQGRLGYYIDQTFAISAYQAFEAMKTDNGALLEKSNFPNLLNYLENDIERRESDVQAQSILSSIRAVAEKEKMQHQLLADSLRFLLESMQRRKEDIRYQNERIKRKLSIELTSWASTNLLEGSKQLL
ncbi:dynamin family protein, partial [Paenisporosarcina sp.]|uniref:dynamin family protein n=1 Tax=Paenisporosarcina sp. TaxID=1932001 RepID=UPI003C7632E5